MPKNDLDFIEKLKQGDRLSFEIIIKQHTSTLYKASVGLGFQAHEADDLVQNVWAVFFDAIKSFEGRSSIRTFLFGILYNKVSEYRKQSKKAESVEDIDSVVDSHFDNRGHWILSHSPVSPDRFLESAQTLSIIQACIEKLPLMQKMAFVLKEVEEEIVDEICKILSVTATHLGVILFRARNQLRECLDHKSR